MSRPPRYQRPEHDHKRGRVDQWGPDRTPAAEIARRISYRGIGKHKDYRAPAGQWTPVRRPGASLCDKYPVEEWKRIEQAMREAVEQSCVQLETGKEFPTRIWIYINDKLHEARITTPGGGEYHGFPLNYKSQEPTDPHDLLRKAPCVRIASH